MDRSPWKNVDEADWSDAREGAAQRTLDETGVDREPTQDEVETELDRKADRRLEERRERLNWSEL